MLSVKNDVPCSPACLASLANVALLSITSYMLHMQCMYVRGSVTCAVLVLAWSAVDRSGGVVLRGMVH